MGPKKGIRALLLISGVKGQRGPTWLDSMERLTVAFIAIGYFHMHRVTPRTSRPSKVELPAVPAHKTLTRCRAVTHPLDLLGFFIDNHLANRQSDLRKKPQNIKSGRGAAVNALSRPLSSPRARRLPCSDCIRAH